MHAPPPVGRIDTKACLSIASWIEWSWHTGDAPNLVSGTFHVGRGISKPSLATVGGASRVKRRQDVPIWEQQHEEAGARGDCHTRERTWGIFRMWASSFPSIGIQYCLSAQARAAPRRCCRLRAHPSFRSVQEYSNDLPREAQTSSLGEGGKSPTDLRSFFDNSLGITRRIPFTQCFSRSCTEHR